MHRKQVGAGHVELDQFNLAQEGDLTAATVGARPGNVLVPVSTYYALYHLEAVLKRVRPDSGRGGAARAIVAARGFGRIRPDAGPAFQHHRAIAVHESAFDGGEGREAGAVGGGFGERSLGRYFARGGEFGIGGDCGGKFGEEVDERSGAWKSGWPGSTCRIRVRMWRWRFLRRRARSRFFILGPHAPRLTPKEIDLLHKIWLRLRDKLGHEELHHHDIVHFALDELERELDMGQEPDVVERLRKHLSYIKDHRPKAASPAEGGANRRLQLVRAPREWRRRWRAEAGPDGPELAQGSRPEVLRRSASAARSRSYQRVACGLDAHAGSCSPINQQQLRAEARPRACLAGAGRGPAPGRRADAPRRNTTNSFSNRKSGRDAGIDSLEGSGCARLSSTIRAEAISTG